MIRTHTSDSDLRLILEGSWSTWWNLIHELNSPGRYYYPTKQQWLIIDTELSGQESTLIIQKSTLQPGAHDQRDSPEYNQSSCLVQQQTSLQIHPQSLFINSSDLSLISQKIRIPVSDCERFDLNSYARWTW
jgi:hypothetical protein